MYPSPLLKTIISFKGNNKLKLFLSKTACYLMVIVNFISIKLFNRNN